MRPGYLVLSLKAIFMANASSGAALSASGDFSPERRLLRNSKFTATIILFVLTGLLSLLVAEQVLTGWLAFGDRINISRRDINLLEILIAAGTLVWALMCLVTAWGFWRHPVTPSLEDYLGGRVSLRAPGVLFTTVLIGALFVGCLFIVEQVLTGWIALGERANISRRDINLLEWSVVLLGVIGALITGRTLAFLLQRDRRAWAWAQWTVLLTVLLMFMALFSGAIDIYSVIPRGGTLLDNVPGVLELVGLPLILVLSAVCAYRYLTLAVDLSADQSIRNRLAKSPGAGAIIGLAALLIGFSLASPLFLEPRAIAGALSTNVTNGIVAIGITLLMISGEFDLSVGSIFGASALIFILAMTEGVFGLPPMNALIAAIMSLIFAGFLGFINGVLLIRTGIPSFIVTLGTLLAYRAIPLVLIPEGRIIRYADYGLDPPYIYFSPTLLIVLLLMAALALGWYAYRQLPALWGGVVRRVREYGENTAPFRDVALIASALWSIVVTSAIVALMLLVLAGLADTLGGTGELLRVSFFDLANGRIEALPVIGRLTADINLRTGVFWWLLLVLVFQFILTQMRYGGFTFAVGGNAGAARAQGISVSRVKITNFIISAVLCGVAGITFVSRVGSVNANLGDGLELEVIAASVIGGVLLTGGYGSIVGALLGVLIFGLLRTGLVLVGMDPRVFFGVQGIIIIVAVVINTAVRRVRT
jgi:ribose/xylose/arabinose/galactoside ABC-type transport system permease subunit